jgi:hypothetical protein
MTKKEREVLYSLVARVEESLDLIHKTQENSLLCGMKERKPVEILHRVIDRLNSFDIYLKYVRFDQEASVRDLDKLLKIIEMLRKECNGTK